MTLSEKFDCIKASFNQATNESIYGTEVIIFSNFLKEKEKR